MKTIKHMQQCFIILLGSWSLFIPIITMNPKQIHELYAEASCCGQVPPCAGSQLCCRRCFVVLWGSGAGLHSGTLGLPASVSPWAGGLVSVCPLGCCCSRGHTVTVGWVCSRLCSPQQTSSFSGGTVPVQ